MKYTDRARARVLDAIDKFSTSEFVALTGLTAHSLRTEMSEMRRGNNPIGILWLQRVADINGLNIAEILLEDDDAIMDNYEFYKGAEVKYFYHNFCKLTDKKQLLPQNLADKSGLSHSTVVGYLCGSIRYPRIDKMEILAESLGEELPDMFRKCTYPLKSKKEVRD